MNYQLLFFLCSSFFLRASQSESLIKYETLYQDLPKLAKAIEGANLEKVKQFPHCFHTYLPRPFFGDNSLCFATRMYVQSSSKQRSNFKKIIIYLALHGADPFFPNHQNETAYDLATQDKNFALRLLFNRFKKHS